MSAPKNRGDIFHDGLLGLWIIDTKPGGNKLYVMPVEELGNLPAENGECSFYHELKDWSLDNVKCLGNFYDPNNQLQHIFK